MRTVSIGLTATLSGCCAAPPPWSWPPTAPTPPVSGPVERQQVYDMVQRLRQLDQLGLHIWKVQADAVFLAPSPENWQAICAPPVPPNIPVPGGPKTSCVRMIVIDPNAHCQVIGPLELPPPPPPPSASPGALAADTASSCPLPTFPLSGNLSITPGYYPWFNPWFDPRYYPGMTPWNNLWNYQLVQTPMAVSPGTGASAATTAASAPR